MRMSRLFAAATAASLLLCATASAQVILGNLPATPAGTGTNLGLGIDAVNRTKGVGLTMGSDSLEFVSLVALMSNTSPASTLGGGIYSNVGGNPGVELMSFIPVPVPENTPPTEFTLTAAGSFTLDANTSYWFVLTGPTTTQSLLWQSLSPNTAPTPAPGISFDGYRFSTNQGASWTNSTIFNGVAINAIPEPATLSLLAASGIALLRRRN